MFISLWGWKRQELAESTKPQLLVKYLISDTWHHHLLLKKVNENPTTLTLVLPSLDNERLSGALKLIF